MTTSIAVINGGSSSIKFSVYRNGAEGNLTLHCSGQVEGIGTAPRFVARIARSDTVSERRWEGFSRMDHAGFLDHILTWIHAHLEGAQIDAVGHRVVHGGEWFYAPVRVDQEVLETLDKLVPLAPLHQPHNIAPIRTLVEIAPDLDQVACFDTAFHHGAPGVFKRFALPRKLHEEGVRRYGFHGLSYEYISRKVAAHDPDAADGRMVVAHLGSGASMCAIQAGRSVASTMGFTALDGLPMGTRTGAMDPGVLLYLMREKGMDADRIEHLIYRESGLLGMSGISNDMRDLLSSDAASARTAVETFVYRINRELGSLMAALGGLDALVFTAGIGEHSPEIREMVCRAAEWAGVRIDPAANRAGSPCISRPDSSVRVWVIPTNEELMIATHTRDLLKGE